MLNEKIQLATNYINYLHVDYCKLKEFVPFDLAFALRFINFTGYTGQIYFSQTILERAIKPTYMYSVNSSQSSPQLVGFFTKDYYSVNLSGISFIDDQIPVSSTLIIEFTCHF